MRSMIEIARIVTLDSFRQHRGWFKAFRIGPDRAQQPHCATVLFQFQRAQGFQLRRLQPGVAGILLAEQRKFDTPPEGLFF